IRWSSDVTKASSVRGTGRGQGRPEGTSGAGGPDLRRASIRFARSAPEAAAQAAGLLGRLDAEVGEGGQRPVEGAAGGGAVASGQRRRDQHGVGVLGPGVDL